MRRIVLAFTRLRVSIRVTGLGFEPFTVCLLDIGFTTKGVIWLSGTHKHEKLEYGHHILGYDVWRCGGTMI